MAHLKAMTLAVVAAIALGAGVGARGVLGAGKLPPADKAAVYSQGISEAVYCAVARVPPVSLGGQPHFAGRGALGRNPP